jgi:uncharacterized membrane protein
MTIPGGVLLPLRLWDRKRRAVGYLWLHLLSFAVYAGSTAALLVVFLPMVRSEAEPRRRLELAAGIMRFYDPLSIGALGVLIMTGAFNLTTYKDALRGAFFQQMGGPLAWKLLLTFLLTNVAAYVAFGIGHRMVSRNEYDEDFDPKWVDSMLRRLAGATVVCLVLVAAITWVSINLIGAAPLATA